MTAQSIEVPIVATVVGGHLKVGDDFQGGVESIIRLRPDYPDDTLQEIEEFSHLQVTWYFSEARPATSRCMPAVLATTRSGRRPERSYTVTTGAPPGSRRRSRDCSAWTGATSA